MLQKNKDNETQGASKPLADDTKMKEVLEKANKVAELRYDKFKSPKSLELTQEQFDALVTTLRLIEEGHLIHRLISIADDNADHVSLMRTIPKIKKKNNFNMAVWRSKYKCGTVACLGGTAEMVAGRPIFQTGMFGKRPEQVEELFYGDPDEDVTETQAARCLRGFLETGEADWVKARKKP